MVTHSIPFWQKEIEAVYIALPRQPKNQFRKYTTGTNSLLLKYEYCVLDSECCCAIAEINFPDETLREDSSQGDKIQEVIRCDLI